METRSPLVHPGKEKAIGLDLLVPPIVYPPIYSPYGGSPVDICLWLCLIRSLGHYKPCLCSNALIKLSAFAIYKPLAREPRSSTSLCRCLQEQKGLLQGEDL